MKKNTRYRVEIRDFIEYCLDVYKKLHHEHMEFFGDTSISLASMCLYDDIFICIAIYAAVI